MIFVILNVFAFAVMLVLSLSIDKSNKFNKNTAVLVNLILFLASIFLIMAASVALCLWGPFQISLLFGRLVYTLVAWFSLAMCVYALIYPHQRKHISVKIFQWLLSFVAFYLMFIQRRGFYGMQADRTGFLDIKSGEVFNKALINFTSMTWFDFYKQVFFFVIPFFAFIMILVRAENEKNRLLRQAHLLNALGMICTWLVLLFIELSTPVQSMMQTLIPLAFIPEVLLFVKSNETEDVWDFSLIGRTSSRIMLNDIFPAAVLGFIFSLIYPVFIKLPALTVLIYCASATVVAVIWMLMGKLFSKHGFLKDSRYAPRLEKELAELSYEESPLEITNKVFNFFKTNVDVSSMKIMIDSGNNNFETIYSSNSENLTCKLDSEIFDTLLNMKHTVVFREFVNRNTSIIPIKSQLLKFLDDSNSDAFIILNEGRQIIGLICLGKKNNQNSFTEYDYNAFNQIYSNLFVIAYYVKNIMNEDVVGTVNREIRMSGQIITSIQENMDKIKNPKVDAGYAMIPAHNIGGEFVDMIRLTDTRYMLIVGALNGKGIAASMSMVILKSIIRTFLAETKDFKMLVEKVNVFIRESLPKGTFFAGTFALLDFTSDTLYYINCGTPALFLYTRAYNNVIEIQGEGHILGFVKDISSYIKVKKVKLAPGDIVLSCTDGLIETKSLRGEEFGRSRIQNAILENLTYPAQKMAQFTYDALANFTSKEIEDDITILFLKYLGEK